MSLLKIVLSPAFLAAAAAVIALLLMKLDCMACRDKQRTTASYCKNMLLVSALVGGSAYALQRFAPMGARAALEEISLGEPDF